MKIVPDHPKRTREAEPFLGFAEEVSKRIQLIESTVLQMNKSEEQRRTERKEESETDMKVQLDGERIYEQVVSE